MFHKFSGGSHGSTPDGTLTIGLKGNSLQKAEEFFENFEQRDKMTSVQILPENIRFGVWGRGPNFRENLYVNHENQMNI